MNAAQMVTHCARALETGTGDRPMKQKFLGKILMPFFRSSILGEKPFSRNSPTDPSPSRMQLGYFHVIAEPVSTWVQEIFEFRPAHLPRFVTKL